MDVGLSPHPPGSSREVLPADYFLASRLHASAGVVLGTKEYEGVANEVFSSLSGKQMLSIDSVDDSQTFSMYLMQTLAKYAGVPHRIPKQKSRKRRQNWKRKEPPLTPDLNSLEQLLTMLSSRKKQEIGSKKSKNQGAILLNNYLSRCGREAASPGNPESEGIPHQNSNPPTILNEGVIHQISGCSLQKDVCGIPNDLALWKVIRLLKEIRDLNRQPAYSYIAAAVLVVTVTESRGDFVAKADPDFIPSKVFAGMKKGWFFGTAPDGRLGYHIDITKRLRFVGNILAIGTIQEPLSEQHTTQKPSSEQHTTQKPSSEQHTTQKPSSEQHTTQKPLSEQHTTQKPLSEQHTTQKPSSEQHTTQKPSSEQHTTQKPSSEQHTTQKPSSEQHTAQKTLSRQHTTQKPLSEQHTAQKTLSRQHTPQKALSEQHTAQKPSSEQHTAQKTLSRQHTAQKPLSPQHTAQKPLSRQHTPQKPLSQQLSFSVSLLESSISEVTELPRLASKGVLSESNSFLGSTGLFRKSGKASFSKWKMVRGYKEKNDNVNLQSLSSMTSTVGSGVLSKSSDRSLLIHKVESYKDQSSDLEDLLHGELYQTQLLKSGPTQQGDDYLVERLKERGVEIPLQFIDPITRTIMRDPISFQKRTYDLDTIEQIAQSTPNKLITDEERNLHSLLIQTRTQNISSNGKERFTFANLVNQVSKKTAIPGIKRHNVLRKMVDSWRQNWLTEINKEDRRVHDSRMVSSYIIDFLINRSIMVSDKMKQCDRFTQAFVPRKSHLSGTTSITISGSNFAGVGVGGVGVGVGADTGVSSVGVDIGVKSPSAKATDVPKATNMPTEELLANLDWEQHRSEVAANDILWQRRLRRREENTQDAQTSIRDCLQSIKFLQWLVSKQPNYPRPEDDVPIGKLNKKVCCVFPLIPSTESKLFLINNSTQVWHGIAQIREVFEVPNAVPDFLVMQQANELLKRGHQIHKVYQAANPEALAYAEVDGYDSFESSEVDSVSANGLTTKDSMLITRSHDTIPVETYTAIPQKEKPAYQLAAEVHETAMVKWKRKQEQRDSQRPRNKLHCRPHWYSFLGDNEPERGSSKFDYNYAEKSSVKMNYAAAVLMQSIGWEGYKKKPPIPKSELLALKVVTAALIITVSYAVHWTPPLLPNPSRGAVLHARRSFGSERPSTVEGPNMSLPLLGKPLYYRKCNFNNTVGRNAKTR